MSARRALFLDRDGVVNIDHGYVWKKEDFEFVDGIFELCRAAKRVGYLILIITNQAGIGRGYYSEEDFARLTTWMRGEFEIKGVFIDDVYFCPFHPEQGVGKYKADSPCRKPRPGMILQAAEQHGIDLADSVLVGDKISDIEAGVAAGIGLNVLFRPSRRRVDHVEFDGPRVGSLSEVVAFLKEGAADGVSGS